MGVSVSNLVRNVLAHALGMVNDIVHDSEQLVRSARDSIEAGVRVVRGQPAPGAEPTLVGWQPVVLELNAVCHECNEILPRGSDASVAVFSPDTAKLRTFLCL